MAEEFSRREVEMILRRTAELELHRDEAIERTTPAELERIAREIGLPEEALRQAIGEAKAGLLVGDPEPTFLDRTFGPALVDARRHVPGTVAWVRGAVERFLEEQGFQLKRNKGETTEWEPASGVWVWLKRTLHAGPYRLPHDVDIQVRIAEVPGGPHPVMVQLRADARDLRRGKATTAGVSLAIGTAAAVTGAALLGMPVELATWGAGTAIGAGGVLLSRSSYRDQHERLQTGLERFLDFLEHAPPPPLPECRRDPWSSLVDFLANGWRR
jgi:hypothetical protein